MSEALLKYRTNVKELAIIFESTSKNIAYADSGSAVNSISDTFLRKIGIRSSLVLANNDYFILPINAGSCSLSALF